MLLFYLSVVLYSCVRCIELRNGHNENLMAPVFFVPGYAGTRLYCNITSSEYVPSACKDLNLTIGKPFMLLFNVSLDLKASECLYQLVTMDFFNQFIYEFKKICGNYIPFTNPVLILSLVLLIILFAP